MSGCSFEPILVQNPRPSLAVVGSGLCWCRVRRRFAARGAVAGSTPVVGRHRSRFHSGLAHQGVAAGIRLPAGSSSWLL